MAKYVLIILLLVALLGTQVARYYIQPRPQPAPAPDWRADLKAKLPALGHRNWIVVADSAYPSQSREGITTVVVDSSQTETLKDVLKLIGETKHVKPNIYEDKELEFVTEADAKGILQYQMDLKNILGDLPVNAEPHESIIAKLDEAAKMYNVIILKTNMTLPYTTVFINLDCAYWDDDKNARVKKAMTKK